VGILKNRTDLQSLTQASRIAGEVCDALLQAAQPGMTTLELDLMANRLLQMNRSTAPFKSFENFGHAICISLNDEIINVPPSKDRFLTEGDVISIAVGSCYKGLHAKAARTIYLGDDVPEDVERLLEGCQAVFPAIVEAAYHSVNLNDLLEVMPQVANQYQLTLIEAVGGCGIGKYLHEEPLIPNNPKEMEETVNLLAGMAFTLMPMMSLGKSPKWHLLEDGWTHVSMDGAITAHFAETCLVTDQGISLLSKTF
jgi:methionyl aminopeptidase